MKQFNRLFVILPAFCGVLLLTGCGTPSGSINYGVYVGYDYPYYGYGYGGCCNNNNPERPDRPERPDKPDRPEKPDRPSTQPVPRSSSNMGQPSKSQMSRPNRAPRSGRR